MTDERVGNYAQVENPRSLRAGGGVVMLVGDLVAAATIGNSVTLDELVNIAGYDTIAVFADVSSAVGDPQLTLTPMTADGATELTSKAPSDVAVSDGLNVIEYTSEGDQVIKVALECDANDTLTVDYVLVVGKTISGA